uniref:Uncharacterized protein n=1 Tax=Rhizophora mucronata TaxID=61149 RepID=A0A2P2K3I3_RHIMU
MRMIHNRKLQTHQELCNLIRNKNTSFHFYFFLNRMQSYYSETHRQSYNSIITSFFVEEGDHILV